MSGIIACYYINLFDAITNLILCSAAARSNTCSNFLSNDNNDNLPNQSAWKQFFFMDCFGFGLLGRSRHSISNGNESDIEHSHSNSSMNSSWRMNHGFKYNNDYITNTNSDIKEKNKKKLSRAATTVGINLTKQTTSASAGALNCRQENFHHHDHQHTDHRGVPVSRRGTGTRKPKKLSHKRYAVKSPSNRALLQTDPLFHLYLICVGLITLSILAIKSLIPGMRIYDHTAVGFAFVIVIILVSIIYTQARSRKVSMHYL